MALAEAYFDESGTGSDSDFLCIAGYIFEKEKAELLEPLWKEMLAKYGLQYFHMTDCNQQARGYSHLSEDQCDAAAREAIELIKGHASQGIAISIEKASLHLFPPTGIWDENPYALIACQVGYGVRKWAKDVGFSGKVAYFFESGAPGYKGARLSMEMMYSNPLVKADMHHASHTFLEKKGPEGALLQCADILAWHWLKRRRQIAVGHKRIRGDFRNLINVKTDVHHYDKESIEAWLLILEVSRSQLRRNNGLHSSLEVLAGLIRP